MEGELAKPVKEKGWERSQFRIPDRKFCAECSRRWLCICFICKRGLCSRCYEEQHVSGFRGESARSRSPHAGKRVGPKFEGAPQPRIRDGDTAGGKRMPSRYREQREGRTDFKSLRGVCGRSWRPADRPTPVAEAARLLAGPFPPIGVSRIALPQPSTPSSSSLASYLARQERLAVGRNQSWEEYFRAAEAADL